MGLRAVIGLGSNLGDRVSALRSAVGLLAKIGKVLRVSRIYESEPVGGPPQGAFLNAAVLFDYDGSPETLLEALQGIESSLGRVRRGRWGPRTIDLDVLLVEGLAMESASLTIPHPRLAERGFAIRPLVDVAPEALDPETAKPYAALAAAADPTVRPTTLDIWGAS